MLAVVICCLPLALGVSLHNVASYGADSGGASSSSAGISAALSAIAADGGGTLYFPPGHYTSRPFNLSSNTVMLLDFAYLEAEAPSTFILVPPLPSYGEGRDKLPNDHNGRFQPFIGIYYAANVTITTNSSGQINGMGPPWWLAKASGNSLSPSPRARRTHAHANQCAHTQMHVRAHPERR